MVKIDRCFVRNQCYRREQVANIERHNERKNKNYGNGDVVPGRANLNVHYKQCEDTYLGAFDRMVEDGTISTWNTKKDSKIIDEFVFDVNTEYFDRNGGYDYAKRFYENVYRFAVEEAGGEEFILSAVMHADERNKALSEQLGRDVYHYHLHVMYIPVVDTEIRWTKRCKDPELVGKVKAVIKQVSNSKKWRSEMITGEDGKRRLSYSYSALQDRFHAHMMAAGYDDIERGQKGSSAEHLDTLEFKIKRDNERSAELAQEVQAKQQQVSGLDKKLAVRKNVASTYHDIDGMAKRSRNGTVILEPEDWETVSKMAKEGVIAKVNASALGKQLESTTQSLAREKAAYKRLYERTLPYLEAVKIAPEQAETALDAILQQHQKQVHKKQHRGRSATR